MHVVHDGIPGPRSFAALDLNLLRVLAAVHRTGSVTAAARQLALTQPAVSHALARLREFFGDVLYVRSASGLHPTRLAQRVAPAAIAHLHALETALVRSDAFDPARDPVHWRLSLSDLGEMIFLPRLATVLRAEAPHARLDNLGVPAAEVGSALESREVDLAIGIFEPFQRGIIEETLFHERYVAITARSRFPGSRSGNGALTAGALSAASLVFASPTATYHEDVQRMIEGFGLAGRALVHARHYAALPELVTTTDLLAIVPLLFARTLMPRWPIRVHELPGKTIEYDVRMIWHETATNDPAHGWLRALVRRLFRQSSNGRPT